MALLAFDRNLQNPAGIWLSTTDDGAGLRGFTVKVGRKAGEEAQFVVRRAVNGESPLRLVACRMASGLPGRTLTAAWW